MAAIGGRPGAYTEPLIRTSIHYGCKLTEEWQTTISGRRLFRGVTIESADGRNYASTDTLEDAIRIAREWSEIDAAEV